MFKRYRAALAAIEELEGRLSRLEKTVRDIDSSDVPDEDDGSAKAERAFAAGFNGIMAYDVNTARKAAGRNGRDDE